MGSHTWSGRRVQTETAPHRPSRCCESKGVVQSRPDPEAGNLTFLRIFDQREWVPPPPPTIRPPVPGALWLVQAGVVDEPRFGTRYPLKRRKGAARHRWPRRLASNNLTFVGAFVAMMAAAKTSAIAADSLL